MRRTNFKFNKVKRRDDTRSRREFLIVMANIEVIVGQFDVLYLISLCCVVKFNCL